MKKTYQPLPCFSLTGLPVLLALLAFLPRLVLAQDECTSNTAGVTDVTVLFDAALINSGTQYAVDLVLDPAYAFDVGAGTVQFTYNDAGLDYNSVTFGTFVTANACYGPINQNPGSGTITLGLIQNVPPFGTCPYDGTNGSTLSAPTTLATVLFDVTDAMEASGLTFTNTTVSDDASGSCVTADEGSESEPLPVELASFTGSLDDERVLLSWATASETNNAGFEIERTNGGTDEWTRMGFVEGRGTTTAAQQYRFTDTALPFEATRLRYRLKQVDFDGTFTYSSEVEVDLAVPQEFRLHGAYPNPFNPQTVIRYELPVSERVRLAVFDALGRQVRVLVDGEQAAGRHEAVFTAGALASGVYFYRLEAGSHVEIRQMMLLK